MLPDLSELTLGYDVYMKRLKHKTSSKSFLCTAPLHKMLWFSQAKSAAYPVTGISLSSSQDILSLIREKGPKTKGIFMACPNGTSWNSLKEKLDTGEEVNIRKLSVHEVAWLLKVGKVLVLSTLRISLSLHE